MIGSMDTADGRNQLRRNQLVRSRAYRRIVERPSGPLPPDRASARLSAYVYGNILTLAAVATATPETIEHGHAALVVFFTGVTTYVAHIFSNFVAYQNVTDARPDGREHALQELADATPIMSSATMPTVALILGWLEVIPTGWAFAIAGGLVVVRIASIQLVAERVRGNPLTPRLVLLGLLTAAVAGAIVVVKVVLTH